ncbi:MAG: cell division protein FtsQ [Betaproteobacteria bacterium RBG_16_56_24]|nr:MAG: cell division protein FtsQ [Betaproteobacteria bacterium RBG_16_56_24]
MWDNAALLRSIANALIGFSVLAALYGAAYYAVHLPGLYPLQSVQLSAAPQRVSPEDVLQVVRNETYGNFFTVDIDHVRQSLEKLPWVRNVTVRREFPHSLVLDMEEHQALARWNGTALVNRQGEVFSAESEQKLPDFRGPDGTSPEITQQYMQFSKQIALLDLQAAQFALSARHAWQLRLNNGMVLELGREDMQQRLAKFVAVQRTEDGRQRTEGAVYVDLRYRNGFAVRQTINVKG